MFDQLTARAISKVGQLQRELDEAKAKIAQLEQEIRMLRAAYEGEHE